MKNSEGVRICPDCGRTPLETEFYLHKGSFDGFFTYCGEDARSRGKKDRKAHPEWGLNHNLVHNAARVELVKRHITEYRQLVAQERAKLRVARQES